MDLSWGRGVASTDAWIGPLDGAVVALDANRVTHLIVKRGPLFPRRYVVPIERLERWDQEGLYLGVSILEVFTMPAIRDHGGSPGTAALTPRTRVVPNDGVSLRLKGLRLTQGEHALTHLIVSHRPLGQRSLLLPADKAAGLDSRQITLGIGMGRAEIDNLPAHRLDHHIESDIWEALYASADISQVDLKGVVVHVVDGVVALEGNVRGPQAAQQAEGVVSSVSGVVGVNARLMDDRDIDLAVASYISREAPRLAADVIVHTQLGTVILQWTVPSTHVRRAMIYGIRLIPGVQVVEDRLEVRAPAPVTTAAPPEPKAASSQEDANPPDETP